MSIGSLQSLWREEKFKARTAFNSHRPEALFRSTPHNSEDEEELELIYSRELSECGCVTSLYLRLPYESNQESQAERP